MPWIKIPPGVEILQFLVPKNMTINLNQAPSYWLSYWLILCFDYISYCNKFGFPNFDIAKKILDPNPPPLPLDTHHLTPRHLLPSPQTPTTPENR